MGTERSQSVERTRRALLAELRRARGGEPMASLARRATGYSRQWLSKLERGELDVSLSQFVALCDALDVHIELRYRQLHPDHPAVAQLRALIADDALDGADLDFAMWMLRALDRSLASRTEDAE